MNNGAVHEKGMTKHDTIKKKKKQLNIPTAKQQLPRTCVTFYLFSFLLKNHDNDNDKL